MHCIECVYLQDLPSIGESLASLGSRPSGLRAPASSSAGSDKKAADDKGWSPPPKESGTTALNESIQVIIRPYSVSTYLNRTHFTRPPGLQ